MCYALIADIHGNLPALQAVLADARAQGAKSTLLLGDNCIGLCWPNEVVEALAALPSCHAVYGNEDVALAAHDAADADTAGQFGAIAWVYRRLCPQSLAWLQRLPEQQALPCPGGSIYMAHKHQHFFGETLPDALHTLGYARHFAQGASTRAGFARYAAAQLEANAELAGRLANAPDGVYVLGHTHLQWQYRTEGKLLVNPGSCGIPLDGDTRAAYALLDFPDGVPRARLRRVKYNVPATLAAHRASRYWQEVPVWAGILAREAETGREYACDFIQFVQRLAEQRGDKTRPFSAALWKDAYSLYCQKYPVK